MWHAGRDAEGWGMYSTVVQRLKDYLMYKLGNVESHLKNCRRLYYCVRLITGDIRTG